MIACSRTRRPGWGTIAAAALALLSAGCATTGSVVGRVDTPGKNKTSDQAVITAARSDSTRKGGKKDSQRAVLQLVDGQFTPAVLLVDPGTEVRIENHDRIFHNAFSVASNAPFDVGPIAPGKSATVTLEQ